MGKTTCKFQIFKNTTPAVTIGYVSPDYRCHQYSNLTHPLGIGPLGCEYSTLLISLSASVPSQGFASSCTLTRDLVLLWTSPMLLFWWAKYLPLEVNLVVKLVKCTNSYEGQRAGDLRLEHVCTAQPADRK